VRRPPGAMHDVRGVHRQGWELAEARVLTSVNG
jgi:hypothetical protein